MVRPIVVAVLAVALLMGPGCLGPPSQAEVFVLSFRLENDGSGDLEANPGPHCGTAKIRDGVLEIEERVHKRLGSEEAFLVVRPSLGPGWASLGYEPYAVGLPAVVATGMQGEETAVAEVAWEEGRIVLDGVMVDLPYAWTVVADDGAWWADAVLDRGPVELKTFRLESCE
jgi:hypothetical protein